MTKENYAITGMTCSACAARVEKSVAALRGVEDVAVNLLKNSMSVYYDEGVLGPGDIKAAVEKAGYGAVSADDAKAGGPKPATDTTAAELKNMRTRVIASMAFAIPLFYLSMGHMFGWPLPGIVLGMPNTLIFAFTQFLLLLPIIYVNFQYYKVGYRTLFQGAPNMDSLIAIGSSAATVYGIFAIYKIAYGFGHGDMDMVHQYGMDLYFESAGVILALITLGKFFEARAKGRTSEAITKLMNLAPKMATVERDGAESVIPAEQVQAGDILIVKAGESVAVDGVLVEGVGTLDESALTGESLPVEKHAGDRVTGATINKAGYFKMRATRVGDDTTLAQIVKLVDEATSSKAPIAKLADRISSVFVPIVIAIAVVATVIWLILGYGAEFALSTGISVLVIS
ncbi:MAG: HAD-IC family P-type ATPase, partial [Oscillospiraceae bacterium]|nr:HAD-IC family P-type ATPase [Oscillospiraceae bacterium]